MYYDAEWTSTDQIPQRAVARGEMDRFGSQDDSTGGDTHRYSLSSTFWGELSPAVSYNANAYIVDYELRLTSNATYYTAATGSDQFTQFDDRTTYGAQASFDVDLNDVHQLEVGANFRYDDIREVGVGGSENARIVDMVSRSAVEEFSQSAYSSVHSQWNDWFASIVGVRYDHYQVDVKSKLAGGADGHESDDLLSPKLSLRFGPFAETEFFVNYGEGFHSNDARGVVDNTSDVPLLSPSKGYELGMRTAWIEDLQFSLVLFRLDLDSELVFVGDDATTEPRGATKRTGFEIGAYYQPVDWFVLDIDYAKSETEFDDQQFDGGVALGRYVPDSIEDVFSLGASFDFDNGYYGGLRMRYFGPRKLTESGDIKSDSTSLVNANFGYRWQGGLSLGVEVINMLDREDDDITYLYESRTRAERDANPAAAPVEDLHSHPVEPRTVRLTVGYEF
jgi:outer membrane receptor protein involved in Fe transport